MLQNGDQAEEAGLSEPLLLRRHEAGEEDVVHAGLHDGGGVGRAAPAQRGEDVHNVGLQAVRHVGVHQQVHQAGQYTLLH